MENQINKIKNALRLCGVEREMRRDVLIYLLVGIYCYSLGAVANRFKISEQKVWSVTSVYHQKLNNPADRTFYKKIHYVTRLVLGVKSNKEQLFKAA